MTLPGGAALADPVLQARKDLVMSVIAGKMTAYIACCQPDLKVANRPPLAQEEIAAHYYADASYLLQRFSQAYVSRLADIVLGASRWAFRAYGYRRLQMPDRFLALPDKSLQRLRPYYAP